MPSTAAQYRALAIKQVGKRYVLGQPVPYKGGNPKALDCSGLVIWLGYESGCHATGGDTTAAGLYNRSRAVSSPRVGDMVFLRNNPARANGIGHVAVITAKLSSGDWEIVEARGRAAGVVRTTLSYWRTRRHYAGIRRLPDFVLAKAPKPKPGAKKPARLTVDGDLGPKTATALQWWLGVPQTGTLNLATRKALQQRLKVTADGVIGPKTVRALQAKIGATRDGRWGGATTKALQRYLNQRLA